MATVKVTLRTSKMRKNGEAPIYIRITKNRRSKFISLGITVLPEHWDEEKGIVRKHKNKTYLNNLIASKVSEAYKVALELEADNKFTTTKSIKQKITGVNAYSFTDYANEHIESLQAQNKIGSLRKARTTFNKLNKYVNNRNLQFSDIDVPFLKGYEKHLRKKYNNSTNTIHTDLKIIRKLYNDAEREEIIPIELNPFHKHKLKTEKTVREYLTEEELHKIEELELDQESKRNHHRNAFVFACYAGGLRFGDIATLRWKYFDGVYITVPKSRKSTNHIKTKLPTKALKILEFYQNDKNSPNDYIFPFLDNQKEYTIEQEYTSINSCNVYANKDLRKIAKKAEIEKHVTFHTSRHTFATVALKKGIRLEYVSAILGHSNIKTTQIYAKIVNSELDKAMDSFEL